LIAIKLVQWEALVDLLSLYHAVSCIAFYFKSNFDQVYLLSFLIKFLAWFDLVVIVFFRKRVKGSQNVYFFFKYFQMNSVWSVPTDLL
jgi:hypothetical protein